MAASVGAQTAALSAADFLIRARTRLEASGFRCTRDAAPFLLAAHRSRFELTKFGNLDTSFLFACFPAIDRVQLDAFSAASFKAALADRGPRLPRGFGEAVFSYAVAVVESTPPDVLEYVRRDMGPKHWAASENRIVFDIATQQLAVCERTPLWGAAYASSQRNLIRSLLG
jgi:hypothetical protein